MAIQIDPAAQLKLGEELKRLRLAKGLKQRDVVNRLCLSSHRTVSLWENGRRIPSVQALLVLAKLFDTTISSLVMPINSSLGGETGEVTTEKEKGAASKEMGA